jgi:hypothetical protein
MDDSGYWNYRVIERIIDSEKEYSIYEVFYDEHDRIETYTEAPVDMSSETVDGLKGNLLSALKGCDAPVLVYGQITEQELEGAE